MIPKENLLTFIKGFILGVANIIPGVSGGTLAVSLGLYEIILNSISTFFTNIKKNVSILLPIILGVIVALISTSKLVTYALNNFKTQTYFLFIGLIFGGTSLIMKKVRGKCNFVNIFIFFLTFTILILLNFVDANVSISFSNMHFLDYLLLVLVGFIASSAMIIPGISGSFVLMIFGYYEKIIATVSNLVNIKEFGSNLLILLPFGVGAIIGIIFMAKLIVKLLQKYETKMYFAIVGFVLSSVVILLLQLEKFTYSFSNIILCILTFLWGYLLARAIEKE